MSPLETKLMRLVAALDPPALEALASKGLLRRAQKDLERGVKVRVTGESEAVLGVGVGDFEVRLPEAGPAQASCSCPAVGVCQHILVAVLFLQQAKAEPNEERALAEEASPAVDGVCHEELMAITPDQLEHWAGKAPFKAGLKLAGQFAPEVVRERAVRVRFPALNAEVHFVPGGGLDGGIASGGPGDHRQLVVAALIGLQRAAGKAWAVPADASALEASAGAPRTRAEVLAACQALLDETLNNGLARVSSANAQRWTTLAVSALGVNLPRLALALRGIGDETALVVARDARSDLARLLSRMAQAHALCSALQLGGEHPRADLVGLHRTHYDEVGHLDLVGVAAWPWRTASGYEGLTVLFWDPAARNWNSWSESRLRHQLADFNPVARYTQPGPWEGAESPRQLVRSSFRLLNARRNPARRLSVSTRSRILVTGASSLTAHGVVAITDWSQLQQRNRPLEGLGLRESNSLDAIVAIQPTTWGERGFDAVTQFFTWVVGDAHGRLLPLEIGFEAFTEPAIQFLEKVLPDSPTGAVVIGRVQRVARGPSVQPYSLHWPSGEAVHLCMDTAKPATSTTPASTVGEESGFEADEGEANVGPTLSPALSRLLDDVDDGLLALAEVGLSAANTLRFERLRQVLSRLEHAGWPGLAGSLMQLSRRPAPSALLRGAHISHLHRLAIPAALSA